MRLIKVLATILFGLTMICGVLCGEESAIYGEIVVQSQAIRVLRQNETY